MLTSGGHSSVGHLRLIELEMSRVVRALSTHADELLQKLDASDAETGASDEEMGATDARPRALDVRRKSD